MKKALITLRANKLFTIRTNHGKKNLMQDLYFFDPVHYIKTLLSSKLKNNIYFNITILVNDKDRVHP